MKYIDAEKLKKYIEYKRDCVCDGLDWDDMDECQRYAVEYLDDILSFIASLQQEQPTKGYDEKYLNEKIAKAKKSWEGVDVDKYMDDVRGRKQQEQPEVDLEKAYKSYIESRKDDLSGNAVTVNMKDFARHFAEWGATHLNARKEKHQ